MPPPPPDSVANVSARITLREAEVEHIFGALGESFDSNATAVVASDHGDGRWTISLHFRDAPNQTAVRALVAVTAGGEIANALQFEESAAKDWVEASLAGLAPVEAGRFVVHGAHDRARMRPNRIGIEIEAALAFGTGHHGTTRGCLLALDRILRSTRTRARVLDLGTGSGVLAIAAARVLHKPVVASDNDWRAVATARANARHNRVGALIETLCAEGLNARRLREQAPFDIVLANILLPPLKMLAAPLVRLIGSNGRIVLSGLLASQSNAALAAYRTHGLVLERRLCLDGWATLVLRRRCRTAVAGRRRPQ